VFYHLGRSNIKQFRAYRNPRVLAFWALASCGFGAWLGVKTGM
jgi:hypothetical protein